MNQADNTKLQLPDLSDLPPEVAQAVIARAERLLRKRYSDGVYTETLEGFVEHFAKVARERRAPPYVCAVQRKPYVKPEDRKAHRELHPFVVPEALAFMDVRLPDPGVLRLKPTHERVGAALQAEHPLVGGRFFRLHAATVSPDGTIEVRDLAKLSPNSTIAQVRNANAAHRTVKRAHRAARMARKRRRGWA